MNNSKIYIVSRFILIVCFLISALPMAQPARAATMAMPQPAPLQLPKEPGITGWDDDTIDIAPASTSRRGRNPVYAAVGIQRSALQEYIRYTSRLLMGPNVAPYPYQIRYHPTTVDGLAHWYSGDKGYWFEDGY